MPTRSQAWSRIRKIHPAGQARVPAGRNREAAMSKKLTVTHIIDFDIIIIIGHLEVRPQENRRHYTRCRARNLSRVPLGLAACRSFDGLASTSDHSAATGKAN